MVRFQRVGVKQQRAEIKQVIDLTMERIIGKVSTCYAQWAHARNEKVGVAMGRKFGFAIAGTGMIARVHARAVQAIGARLVAVCSRQLSRAEAFAAEFVCRLCISTAMLACLKWISC